MMLRLSPIRALLAAAVLATGAAALAAQSTPAIPGAPDMSHPPAVGATPGYAPPASQTDQLPNGLTIVTVEDRRFPLVTVRMAIAAGKSRLQSDQAGLADAEADLLTAGVPGLTSLQIAQEADAMGGTISASAGDDYITISASALSNHARELFQLLSQVVLHPTVPESEVALRKANMLQDLISNRADSTFLAGVAFDKRLYQNHPYAIAAPTKASIAAITREALVKFHNEYFLPNNHSEIVITGDIPAARAHNLAQQYFGGWTLGNPPAPPSPKVPAPNGRSVYVINRPESPQSTVLMGNFGLTRKAPDYFPFLVANEVLGGSFSSRLTGDVREKKGYAYFIYSYNEPHLDMGAWVISTQVRTGVTAKALDAVNTQLNTIRATPVTTTELRQAKNYLTGNFVLGLQTQSEVANEFLTTGIYNLPSDRLATWVGNVNRVSDAEALAAAKQNIHPDHDIIVVVGDAKQIEPTLLPFASSGHITELDDAGNVVGQYPGTSTPPPTGGH